MKVSEGGNLEFNESDYLANPDDMLSFEPSAKLVELIETVISEGETYEVDTRTQRGGGGVIPFRGIIKGVRLGNVEVEEQVHEAGFAVRFNRDDGSSALYVAGPDVDPRLSSLAYDGINELLENFRARAGRTCVVASQADHVHADFDVCS